MPQMAPLWWSILLVVFSILLTFMIIKMNFYSFKKNTNMSLNKKSKNLKMISWTW